MKNSSVISVCILFLMIIQICFTPSKKYDSASWIVFISLGISFIYFLDSMKGNVSKNIPSRISKKITRNINLINGIIFLSVASLVVFKISIDSTKLADILSIFALIITLATNEIAPKIIDYITKNKKI